jgi:hypothetical protein
LDLFTLSYNQYPQLMSLELKHMTMLASLFTNYRWKKIYKVEVEKGEEDIIPRCTLVLHTHFMISSQIKFHVTKCQLNVNCGPQVHHHWRSLDSLIWEFFGILRQLQI